MPGGNTSQKINVDTLQPGTFGVVSTNGVVSAGIRVTTRSPFSHAFVYLGRGMVVEAQPGGAIVSHIRKFLPGGSYGATSLAVNDLEPLTDEQRAGIIEEARLLVGVPYGFTDIALLFAHSWLHYDSKALVSRVEHERALICSQLVARAYYLGANVDLGLGRPDALVTPGDLALRITERLWE